METVKLPFPLTLGLRYLRSTRRDAFINFLSMAAAAGIALGVAALILALAALSGFQTILRGEILERTPHLEVALPAGASAADLAAALEGLPGVVEARATVRGRGWLMSEGRVRAVEMVGFSDRVPAVFPGAAGEPEGLYLPEDLLRRWGLVPGDRVDLVSGRPALSPLGPQPRIRRQVVAGAYRDSRAVQQAVRVAVPLEVAHSLLGVEPQTVQVMTTGLGRALRLQADVEAAAPAGSDVESWQEINRPLFFALRLEKAVMFVAVFLIVLVAGFALIADLALLIASKRSEIGMLGAMGATRRDLRAAFLLLGSMLAGIGTLVGAGAGTSLAWLLGRYELLPLPGQAYFVDHVPFLIRGGDLAWVLVGTVAVVVLAALAGSWRAAAIVPVEALRR